MSPFNFTIVFPFKICELTSIFTNLVNRFDKKIRYASRKARADVRKRVKGRFIKAGEAYDYDPLSQTRSY